MFGRCKKHLQEIGDVKKRKSQKIGVLASPEYLELDSTDTLAHKECHRVTSHRGLRCSQEYYFQNFLYLLLVS
jgi:hypothetical protein